MECKFEHDGDCCNCGSPQYMCKCKPKICGSIVPITNADRIRAMTDWELAVVSVRYEGTVVNATRYGGHEHKFYGPHGEPCANKEQAILMWFNWLQQPAEEDT